MANNIFMGLNIGRSALLAQQTALEVTGHNLANTQTEGYTRQRASLQPSLPILTAQGPQGSGVDVNRIQRLQANYMERQVLKAKTEDGYNAAFTSGLDELQTLLGEPSSDGLGGALTELWNAWEDLSAQPSDAGMRAQVVDRAQHLALVYNQKIEGFQAQEETLEAAVAGDVAEVNALTVQLADLNKSIAQSEASGYTANDLRDQRDLVVEQLAQKVGVEAESSGSYVNVRLSNGGPYLVQGVSRVELETNTDGTTGAVNGVRVGGIENLSPGGSIGALVDLRKEVSPGLRSGLADLMGTVVDRMNSLHLSGFDRDGVQGGTLFGWSGAADSTAFEATQGIVSLSPDADLPAGTHRLEVVSVDGLAANSNGTLTGGVIKLTASLGTYQGPRAINLDYHVRVLSGNDAQGSLTGAKVQLYRGDEAVGGDPVVLGAASSTTVTWTVDGVTFTADISSKAGEGRLGADTRGFGLSTTGRISLDGGAATRVDLTVKNNIAFPSGTDLGYPGTGNASVNFAGSAFSGGTFSWYGNAGRLFVQDPILRDTDKLAAAGAPATGATAATGDGETARRIGDLSIGAIFQATGETAAGFLGRLVQALGTKVRDAQVFQKAGEAISAQLDKQKQASSGVSTDEEMVNLMQYQRGYQAAAKFLTTVDTLLETLINNVGR